eukprot:3115989-Rhodomonas_salina.1
MLPTPTAFPAHSTEWIPATASSRPQIDIFISPMWFAANCALHPLAHVRGGWWERRQEEVERVERRAMGGGR